MGLTGRKHTNMTIKKLIKELSKLEYQDNNIVLSMADGAREIEIEEIIHYGDSEFPDPQHHYEIIPNPDVSTEELVECHNSPLMATFLDNHYSQ